MKINLEIIDSANNIIRYCKCQLGTLSVQSFCKRSSTVANQFFTREKSDWDPVIADKLSTVRMRKILHDFLIRIDIGGN